MVCCSLDRIPSVWMIETHYYCRLRTGWRVGIASKRSGVYKELGILCGFLLAFAGGLDGRFDDKAKSKLLEVEFTDQLSDIYSIAMCRVSKHLQIDIRASNEIQPPE